MKVKVIPETRGVY